MATVSKADLFRELRRTAEELAFPIDVLFELTGRCNLNCKMCYVHTMTNAEALSNELSTDAWREIFDQAISAGMMFATLSGGECLLRSDFKELYSHLYKHGVQIIVKTNGILLSDNWIEFFKSLPPREIQISLYGTNDEEYFAVTEKRACDIVFKNIKAVADSGLNYLIQITPSKEAKPFFYSIIDYLIMNAYPFQLSQILLSPREGEMSNSLDISSSDICDYLCYISKQKGKRVSPIDSAFLPPIGTGGENIKEIKHCTAGKNRCQIDWRGNMHPCVALPNISASTHDVGFKNAWNFVHNESIKLEFPIQCGTCAYKNNCKPCYAARCNNGNPAICNDQYCELIREKVSRGLSKVSIKGA